MPPGYSELFTIYGPAAGVIIILALIVKYLLDERKQMVQAHKVEIAAERANTATERAVASALQAELLTEARGNGDLAVSVKEALEALTKPKGAS